MPVDILSRGIQIHSLQDKPFRLLEILFLRVVKPCKIIVSISIVGVFFDGLLVVFLCFIDFILLKIDITEVKICRRQFFAASLYSFIAGASSPLFS